ncbi:MAG TPA: hypothetical protein VF601_03925 [Beijerinckiaceae bacterium]|jgi:hypothetical protein
MSSSISSSDGLRSRPDPWRRFALALAAGAAALLALALAAAWLLDPYDTGRSPLALKPGVRPQGPRTANASRGRDLAFDAAIIGNSHIQALSPERLDQLTGLSFVQLSIVATGPKEQFPVLDWFLRHHPRPRALVIGADRLWCEPEIASWNDAPFPFWLYSGSLPEYVRGLLRRQVLEEIPPRIRYLLSRRPARARPDGYWDYGPAHVAAGYMTDPARRAALERRSDDYVRNPTGRFPAAERLRDVVAGLPTATAVVVVVPPTYRSLLPTPGSPGDADNRACKAALAGALAGRANAAVVDWRRDRPETHVADWFFDWTHYGRPLAELVERDVAEALARARANLRR